MTWEGELLDALAADPPFAGISLVVAEVAGEAAVLARMVPPARAVELWRAARPYAQPEAWPLLTSSHQIDPEMEPSRLLTPLPLAEARRAREQVVRASGYASDALRALPGATPQPTPYDERDSFLEDPDLAQIDLVVRPGPKLQSMLPFTADGEGARPRHPELVGLLQHLDETCGLAPLYGDSAELELEVGRAPSTTPELRAVARDVFLLSQGNREGLGIEEPARLLRRLTSDRWVLWWYGT